MIIGLVTRVLFYLGYPITWLFKQFWKILQSFPEKFRGFFTELKAIRLKPLSLRFSRPIVDPRNWFANWALSRRQKLLLQSLHTPPGWSDWISYDWIDPPKRQVSRGVWTVVAVLLFVCVSGIGGTGWWIYQSVFNDLPSILTLETRQPAATTRIYDRKGRLLYKVFEEENRTPIPLEEMSPYLVQATLAIEDRQYYEHWGFSLRGVTRAAWHNFNNETTQGGSTITQQLVKNTLLSRERTWRRKLREVILAVAVDARYSKQQILEWYLNDVNYGGAIYGAEEASQWYFGKSARDLTLAESSLLAGLPNAPTLFNPFGPQPERSLSRQHEVLRNMEEIGVITAQQRETAEREVLTYRTATYEIQAPHFVMMVRDQLAQQYGEDVVAQGGLEVWTTLDLDLQASAEAAVRTELDRIGRLQVSNGAALVTDPRSGEVLAMVGSRNYFDTANDGQVNVVLRQRQPGSSIKPLTYALAFERGWSPTSTIEDTPVQFTAPGAPPYVPKNYDGRFHGKVTLREALGSSYNIPAVRLLADVGIENLIRFGKQLGINSWSDPTRFGLALTLGGGEVTMYEMAQVYGTFANIGTTVPLNPILEIKDVSGKQMYRNPCQDAVEPCSGKEVMKPLSALQITDVLSDNAARTPAFGARSALMIPNQDVAVKTGTTNSLRDNWTIGYTRDRVVLTWVGNNDNTPMSAVASGVTGASPIWNSLMTTVLDGRLHRFALPAGMERVQLCQLTGTLACSACPKIVEEVLPTERVPKTACSAEDFLTLRKVNQDKPGLARR